MMTDATDAPTVAVVMPFHGDRRAAVAALSRIGSIRLGEADEAILVDNTSDGIVAVSDAPDAPHVRVVRAPAEQTSYHARNVGAGATQADWILFIDADCLPPADLIERYLSQPVGEDVGMLAGPIEPSPGQEGLLAEWAVSREILNQDRGLERGIPSAATANVMVRKRAWTELGGFQEGVRSGADHEFSWRLADAGWRIEGRPNAGIQHLHRTSLKGIAKQMGRYAAGNAWQRRRRPGSVLRHRLLVPTLKSVVGAPYFAVTLRFRRAGLKLVDLVAIGAQAFGGLRSNSPRPKLEADPRRIVFATDWFPSISETFVTGEINAVRRLGRTARIEAFQRPSVLAHGAGRRLDIRYAEDETSLGKAAAMFWIVARHPVRSLSDRRLKIAFQEEEWTPLWTVAPMARRLVKGDERHVHVHFAALASVIALRAARIAGCSVSIAAHGHDVFRTPRALPEKLRRASFVAAPCEYTAAYLRSLSPDSRIETVVMGVDGHTFTRREPYPGTRRVIAIGRLVEKKGFGDLIRATSLLEDRGDSLDEVLILGDGALRRQLEDLAGSMGVGHRVSFLGSRPHDEVRAFLDKADLLVMPCVIAADGDRDAMPVVVKEALAGEVPVVATDEVGLPEVVKEEWGELAPPGDPEGLASAIASVLGRNPGRRAEMGRRGRSFVVQEFSQQAQALKLVTLIESVS